MLLKRGKEFLADGDLVYARLLLRRAAEGGSAEAALVLGTTFDPLVIAAWRARGASGSARLAIGINAQPSSARTPRRSDWPRLAAAP